MHSMFQDGLVEYDGMMLSFEEIFLFKGMPDPDSTSTSCDEVSALTHYAL